MEEENKFYGYELNNIIIENLNDFFNDEKCEIYVSTNNKMLIFNESLIDIEKLNKLTKRKIKIFFIEKYFINNYIKKYNNENINNQYVRYNGGDDVFN